MSQNTKPLQGGIGIDRLHCKDNICMHCFGREIPFSQFWNYIDAVAYDEENLEIIQE